MTLAERLREEPNYRPYCLNCSTMTRMERTETGFFCNPTTRDETHDFLNQTLNKKGLTLVPIRYGCGNFFEVVL